MPSEGPDGRRRRGRETREALVDAAVRSFRDRGYDATTIRALAAETGMSVGSANYHFRSKADLVQELYLRVQREHRDTAIPALATARTLTDRLRVVYETGLATLEPFHDTAPEFLAAMFSPAATINPLSEESTEARDVVLAVFRDAVAGARPRLTGELAAAVTELAYLVYLLLVLYWVYDATPDRRRTAAVLDGGLDLARSILPFLRLPGARPVVRRLIRLVEQATPGR